MLYVGSLRIGRLDAVASAREPHRAFLDKDIDDNFNTGIEGVGMRGWMIVGVSEETYAAEGLGAHIFKLIAVAGRTAAKKRSGNDKQETTQDG